MKHPDFIVRSMGGDDAPIIVRMRMPESMFKMYEMDLNYNEPKVNSVFAGVHTAYDRMCGKTQPK